MITPSKKRVLTEGTKILAAREDVNAFISYCFLDGRPQHRFHARWQKFADVTDYGVIFAPIEHGKTEQMSIWRTLWELGRNPNLRFWIMSAKEGLTLKIIAEISQSILSNEKIHRVFPNLAPEDRKGNNQAWNTTQLIVRRDLNLKDPSVEATPVMGSAIGSRIDRLLADDVMSFANTIFDGPREHLVDWIRGTECMGRITAEGRVLFVNNAWIEQDLAHVLVKENDFKALHDVACDDNLNNILWPMEISCGKLVGFDRARLETKRKKMGPVEFARCFLNRTITAQTQYFSMKSMKTCCMEGLTMMAPMPPGWLPLCTIDPAVGKSQGRRRRADWGIIYGSFDPLTSRKRIRYMKSGQMDAREGLSELLRLHRLEPTMPFLVESNGQQEYLIQIITTPELARGLGATEQEISRLKGLVRPFLTTGAKHDPSSGIPSMAADFEAKLWEIPQGPEIYKWFVQAMDYRPGKHTGDLMMASYFFWHETNRLSMGRKSVGTTLAKFAKGMEKDKQSDFVFAGILEEQF